MLEAFLYGAIGMAGVLLTYTVYDGVYNSIVLPPFKEVKGVFEC